MKLSKKQKEALKAAYKNDLKRYFAMRSYTSDKWRSRDNNFSSVTINKIKQFITRTEYTPTIETYSLLRTRENLDYLVTIGVLKIVSRDDRTFYVWND